MYKIVWGLGMAYILYSLSNYERKISRMMCLLYSLSKYEKEIPRMVCLLYSLSKYVKEIPHFVRDDSSFWDIKGGRSGDLQVNR